MDLDQLRRAAMAARERTVTLADVPRVQVQLRLPTRHEVQLALRRTAASDDAAQPLVLERHLLERALVGWQGVQIRDVLPGHPNDDLLDHAPEAVPLLLDAQPDWAAQWSLQLFGAMREQQAAVDAAAKN